MQSMYSNQTPLGIEWTYINVELLESKAYSLIQALATGKKIKNLSKEEVRNLDNVLEKRACPHAHCSKCASIPGRFVFC